jgi:tetratricopeptide (TPR) repeat protein
MGVKLYRTQHYKEANRCFDQSLSKHSKNPTANYYKAITLQQMGDTESAEQVYRRIVKNYPRTPEARLSAGVVAKLEAMKNPAAKADTAQPSVQHVQNVRSVGGSKSATPVPKNSGRTAK